MGARGQPFSTMADALFQAMQKKADSDPAKVAEMAKKTKAVFQFVLPTAGEWVVDLKSGGEKVVYKGKADKADCTLSLKDDDFLAMATGKLNGQQAFMAGKLKLKGNMMLAQKLGGVLDQLK